MSVGAKERVSGNDQGGVLARHTIIGVTEAALLQASKPGLNAFQVESSGVTSTAPGKPFPNPQKSGPSLLGDAGRYKIFASFL
nr:hypothetical protein P9270_022075 [Mesorhizobium sp. WSM4875]